MGVSHLNYGRVYVADECQHHYGGEDDSERGQTNWNDGEPVIESHELWLQPANIKDPSIVVSK